MTPRNFGHQGIGITFLRFDLTDLFRKLVTLLKENLHFRLKGAALFVKAQDIYGLRG